MRLVLVAFALLLVPAAAAQQQADPIPYFTAYLPLSAEALGVAEAGAFGATADPLRMLDNPALLGEFADGVTVSGDYLPDWLGFGDFTSAAPALATGTRTTLAGRPASVGVGLAYAALDAAPATITDATGAEIGTFDSGLDQTLSLGVGVAVEGPVRVRAGGALRGYRSAAYPQTVDGNDRATALSLDLGLDVTAPIGRWLMPAPSESGLQWVTDLTAGYAIRGLGLTDSAPTFDVASSFTASGAAVRVPTAGLSLLVGLDLDAGTSRAFRASSFEVLTAAEAPGAEYWGELSAKHVLLGVGDEFGPSLVRRGIRFTLAEVLTISDGTMRGANFLARASRGVAVSAGGALRGLGRLGAGDHLYELGRRYDLRYTYAVYTFDGESNAPFGRTPAHTLTLRVRP